MHILLVASAFNSLTQRVLAELQDHGHTVGVELALGDDDALRAAVRRHAPGLIVAPMLTTAIPEDVWRAHTCLIVHPGPPGDRGPSSLDWTLQGGAESWGVTVLEAVAEMDAGDVWAWSPFKVPALAGKSDLYRGEVADAAVDAVMLAVERFASGRYKPQPQRAADLAAGWRPFMKQAQRRIDWRADSTASVLRQLRAADSQPGVLDELLGAQWYLHGGHPEDELRGAAGELIATRAGAICRATVDGAVWIPQLRPWRAPGSELPSYKLPAVEALGELLPFEVPEVPAPLQLPAGRRTWTDIRYSEHGGAGEVGVLNFSFPGGAMSTVQCRRLLEAYRFACTRPTSVLVLGGVRDFFSNGIHLNVIEAAESPAEESWANINAMNDLVHAVLATTDRLTVSALGGNAAAGGVMLALAADEVWCRDGVVLNPHYVLMGLHGSEYWTYTLPRRVGEAEAQRLTQSALPVSAKRAVALGMAERVLQAAPEELGAEVTRLATELAASPELPARIAKKKAARERDEAIKPLRQYRDEELAHMRRNFFDPAEPHAALRSAFVRKQKALHTPPHVARLGLAD
ncbi:MULTISPECIES: enoyl-CoA hydratase-related protein [Variovorax]|jgi:putative two-component system protein, hydrogenase maturation factor HypX/HoxX|uniref:enoyl-CoA hydratase-related protein n=1 Tax=Variovorax TaxID=34072 RepID=UPI0008691B76|nr:MULTISPECIES: enoyl-CoA hydratase-related protein [Variovorax]MBN8756447.1 hydrogenase maturation protein [Variovorax sp.]ODU13551.1 MAG: hydrogenase maturation protein [Variovorax sp. SCN 67-85]ODV25023.1 MAG: hydrogenase maturation protein [Variovorax sp. SCN 67-20]OJZ11160.1 MAG: hydrogenase maturation protein [Variovorax sp. 67-131]UKI06422.1 enoyl-CoA hydratase-related protein [Variovorax paradoxus]